MARSDLTPEQRQRVRAMRDRLRSSRKRHEERRDAGSALPVAERPHATGDSVTMTDRIGALPEAVLLGLTGSDFVGKSESEIAQMLKRAYRDMARQQHPDRVPVAQRPAANKTMDAITKAYHRLRNPATRADLFAGAAASRMRVK